MRQKVTIMADIEKEINNSLKVLREGGLLLYPTDTVWGIGCDATNEEAVKKVFELKKRSEAKSLITLASSVEMIEQYVAQVPPMAYELIEVNDAPMTIIYPEVEGLASNVIAEDGTAGIRVPLNDFCLRLIRKFGKPVVSTSANVSNGPTPKTFKEITETIVKGVDYCVDPSIDSSSTHKASQIIKLGLDGTVKIIRA